MKLFKIVACKAGRIVFDDRVQADSPAHCARADEIRARAAKPDRRGLFDHGNSRRVDQGTGQRAGGGSGSQPERTFGQCELGSADRLGGDRCHRSAAPSHRAAARCMESAGQPSTTRRRFDAFQRESTPANTAATPAPEQPAAAAAPATPAARAPRPRKARQVSGRTVADVNWAMVRRFYSRNKSPKQTAAHFDLSLNTVKARIRRENW